ncbi:putative trans-2-enoyl-CoA reductase 1, mitochondrial [Trichinella nativa]|uniref:Enoyl-[acyl-carrier-protein] reductase, mitochondrial n=1 Tax=Trichinella nativa TaxID=6335 RepID=A0A0V1L3U5_9BILA|nr:putative trans-2-enoyl-CoA reductase 1, mitochondrial [Trichinella nativa]
MHPELIRHLLRNHKTLFRRHLRSQQLTYAEHGHPEQVLQLRKVKIPSALQADQVQYSMLAASINPADINQIQGVYPLNPSLPAVGGNEGVLRIEAVGSEVTNLRIGDWAIPAQAGFGTWRNVGVTNAKDLLKINNKLSVAEAATLAVNPSTAYRMLQDFVHLQPGDVVLQNGATSAVGQNVIQLCKHFGYTSVNIIRDKSNIVDLIDYLKELGADHILTETQLKVVGEDAQMLFNNIAAPKLGLNCISGRSTIFIAAALCPNGKLVTYGGMSKQPLQVPTGALIFKRIQLHGFWMSAWNAQQKNQTERLNMLNTLTDLLLQRKLRAPRLEMIPFKDYKLAIKHACDATTTAKKQLLVFES